MAAPLAFSCPLSTYKCVLRYGEHTRQRVSPDQEHAVMATINDFVLWLDDIGRFSDPDSHLEVISRTQVRSSDGVSEDRMIVRFFTDNNSYKITAIQRASENTGGSYMSCQATARKPRAGEDQARGADLTDGPLSEQTWMRILGDIVSFETVRLSRRTRALRDYGYVTYRQASGMAQRARPDDVGPEGFGWGGEPARVEATSAPEGSEAHLRASWQGLLNEVTNDILNKFGASEDRFTWGVGKDIGRNVGPIGGQS